MRISETKEDHDSVATQRKRLMEFAAANEYEVVYERDDDGRSAFSGKPRPGWLALLTDMKAQKFDVILAVAEDRLARNSMEKTGFQVDCARAGVTWHTIAGGRVDPADAGGALLATITGAVAQYESAIKVERLKARFEEETQNGRPLWGVRPFGYQKDRMTLELSEAEQIRWAYSVVLSGGTIYSILKRWNESGILTSRGGPWSYAAISQLLKRPRNAGIVERLGSVVPVAAQWETIVDRETYDSAIAVLRDPRRRTAPGRKQVHLAAGIARCGVCGAVMRSAGTRINGEVVTHYRCSSKANLQAGRDTRRHSAIQTRVLDRLARDAVVQAFVVGPNELIPARSESPASLLSLRSKLTEAKAKLIGLVADGLAEPRDVAKELTEIRDETAGIEAQLAQLSQQSAHAAMTVNLKTKLWEENQKARFWENAADTARALSGTFDALPIEQRRELVRSLLTIEVGPGRGTERVVITHLVVLGLNDERNTFP